MIRKTLVFFVDTSKFTFKIVFILAGIANLNFSEGGGVFQLRGYFGF